MKVTKKLTGLWVRILLFIFFLLACTTLFVWQFKGEWVNQFDRLVVKSYHGYYKDRLRKTLRTVSKNSNEGIVLLSQLLDDLSDVHKSDRLDHVKRKAFEALVEVLNDAGRNEEALVWAERWVAFDDRDLFGQIWLVKLLKKSPDSYKESWVLISELYRKIPNSALIAPEYAEFLVERGEFTDAFLAVYNVLKRQTSFTDQAWQVFWDTGKGFNGTQKHDVVPIVDDNGELSFRLDVPSHIVKLRIDPPLASRINLVNPILTDDVNLRNNQLFLLDNSVRLSDMVQTSTSLMTLGKRDPYFYWDMRGVSIATGDMFFVCTLEETIPAILHKIFQLSDHVKVEKELVGRNKIQRAKEWHVVTEEYKSHPKPLFFKDVFLEIFWKSDGQKHSVERLIKIFLDVIVKDGVYTFESRFPIANTATELRIDFPDIKGKSYTLETMKIVGDGWSHNIDLQKVDLLQVHMLEKTGTDFKVVGHDPYFVFSVPCRDKIIEHVVVQGTVH